MKIIKTVPKVVYYVLAVPLSMIVGCLMAAVLPVFSVSGALQLAGATLFFGALGALIILGGTIFPPNLDLG